jgi:hypothetical protein
MEDPGSGPGQALIRHPEVIEAAWVPVPVQARDKLYFAGMTGRARNRGFWVGANYLNLLNGLAERVGFEPPPHAPFQFTDLPIHAVTRSCFFPGGESEIKRKDLSQPVKSNTKRPASRAFSRIWPLPVLRIHSLRSPFFCLCAFSPAAQSLRQRYQGAEDREIG